MHTCGNKESKSRSEWMENNPYRNDQNLDPNWLDSYQPYKDWLKEYTMEHTNQIYYVEPFKKLAFEKSEGFKFYRP